MVFRSFLDDRRWKGPMAWAMFNASAPGGGGDTVAVEGAIDITDKVRPRKRGAHRGPPCVMKYYVLFRIVRSDRCHAGAKTHESRFATRRGMRHWVSHANSDRSGHVGRAARRA